MCVYTIYTTVHNPTGHHGHSGKRLQHMQMGFGTLFGAYTQIWDNIRKYTQVYANIRSAYYPAGHLLMGAPQPLSSYGISLLIANYCPPGMLNICSPPGIIELCRAECPVHYSTHLTSTRLSTPRYGSSGRRHFGGLWAQPGNGQSGHIVQNDQERR